MSPPPVGSTIKCYIYVGGGGQDKEMAEQPIRVGYRKAERGMQGVYPGGKYLGDWRFRPGTPPGERRCYRCGGIGHIRATCPYKPSSDTSPESAAGVAAHAPVLRRRRRRGRPPSAGDNSISPCWGEGAMAN